MVCRSDVGRINCRYGGRSVGCWQNRLQVWRKVSWMLAKQTTGMEGGQSDVGRIDYRYGGRSVRCWQNKLQVWREVSQMLAEQTTGMEGGQSDVGRTNYRYGGRSVRCWQNRLQVVVEWHLAVPCPQKKIQVWREGDQMLAE